MGDFDIFNFLYALAAFVIGAAAILGAMLALMSVFPIQKIDNRESMLCQRLNEMVSIASQNVITLDEFMMRRQLLQCALYGCVYHQTPQASEGRSAD